MKTHYIELTDGSRLPVNINFATVYYMQKSGADAMLKRIGKRKLTDDENMEIAAKLIYVILRSNGKMVSFDEAMRLMPMDTDVLDDMVREFKRKMDDFKKKQAAKQNMRRQGKR